MLHIDNATVAKVLPIEDAVHLLSDGYREYADQISALVPRVDLWSPTERQDGYYCLGTMAGTSPGTGVTALRIKSDVTYWPEGKTQEKYAKERGLYCGFVLVFDNATGAPRALINDGVLQHVRVGAAAGVAIDELAREQVRTLGLLGSGGMAATMMEAALSVRAFANVKVYSPTPEHRDAFATRMQARFSNAQVESVESPDKVSRRADVVISATDSMTPTIDPIAIAEDALVVTVSRREVSEKALSRFDHILQLGRHTFPPNEALPEMVFPQSGMAGFVAGSSDQQQRLPWRAGAIVQEYPTLIDRMAQSDAPPLEGRVLVMNTGTQGIQFVTMAAHVLRIVEAKGLGTPISEELFLQDIRD